MDLLERFPHRTEESGSSALLWWPRPQRRRIPSRHIFRPNRRDDDFGPQDPSPIVGTTTLGLKTPPRPSGRQLWASTPLADRRDDNFGPQDPSPIVGTTTLGLKTPPRPSGRRLWASIDSTRPPGLRLCPCFACLCRTAPAGSIPLPDRRDAMFSLQLLSKRRDCGSRGRETSMPPSRANFA